MKLAFHLQIGDLCAGKGTLETLRTEDGRTLHRIACRRSPGRYDMTCPRCAELWNGAKPRQRGYSARAKVTA